MTASTAPGSATVGSSSTTEVDLPLVPRSACLDGSVCGPDEHRVGNVLLPTCETFGCCRTLCEPSNPMCPAGTTCTSLGLSPPAIYADIGACLE